MSQEKGKLVVVEGMDGAGKTTFINVLEQLLTAQGKQVKIVKGIGGDNANSISGFIRDKVVNERLDEEAVQLAIALSHLDSLKTMTQYRDEGYYVIADRSIASYFAYNCTASEYSFIANQLFEYYFAGHIYDKYRADLSIYIDVDADVCKNRIEQRPLELKYTDKRPLEYFNKLREAYLNYYRYIDTTVIFFDNNYELSSELRLAHIEQKILEDVLSYLLMENN